MSGREDPLKVAGKMVKARALRSSRARALTLREALRESDIETFLTAAGLDERDFSDAGRAALASLLGETSRLHQALEKARARVSQLERLADEDAMVPVANRRAFMRELSRLLSLAQRYGTESSIVYVDLNDMKSINDRFGHNAGDAALRHVARVLLDNVRHADVVGRLGGDEFGVLLVKTDQVLADEKAQALAFEVEQRPVLWNGLTLRLTVACGAYCFRGEETVADAVHAADQAMYRSKLAMKTLAAG